jgi:excisionase family DNA binding protein
MTAEVQYGQGTRMLMLAELCEWLNIAERHARKLVARDAIPYRKIGHLLRFPEAEVEAWSRPSRTGRRMPILARLCEGSGELGAHQSLRKLRGRPVFAHEECQPRSGTRQGPA